MDIDESLYDGPPQKPARMKTVAELEQTVIKYMRLVGMQEGTDFVDHAMEGTEPWEFTREEIATLERLSREGE